MKTPQGKLLGLKPSELEKLRKTYRRRSLPGEVVSLGLAQHLVEFSRMTSRQVGVLLSRKGEVEWVVVGDAHRLELPDIGRMRAGSHRLRGLRLVHTHLKGEPLSQDDLTDLALLRLDMVVALGMNTEGELEKLFLGHLLAGGGGGAREGEGEGALWQTQEMTLSQQPDAQALVQALEEEFGRLYAQTRRTNQERALLVTVQVGKSRREAEERLAELEELARTAGLEVAGTVVQLRKTHEAKTLLGKGKLLELNLLAMQKMAEVAVIDQNLSPSQAHHIAKAASLKVIDRTQLILDIFAQRAQSAEGKLQVELAQLKYLLPRLSQSDTSFSRLAGGIGTRGPGETKLEVDRRRVRERIVQLERGIENILQSRKTRRMLRQKRELPLISIVGYTNAGKTTLLNALTHASALAEDKLFATLEPLSRRLRFPREREVIISDTVGFIRDLPKDLLAAFRATLEELHSADLLLHLVDVSDAAAEKHLRAVETLLEELALLDKPRLLVWNKADRLGFEAAQQMRQTYGGVILSAHTGEGMEALLEEAAQQLFVKTVFPNKQ
ncbi:MAG: GTPase HflX [Cystobacterineae bacterium]|nr:GTPase HflX [Cystobacterineae bacterium]